jgi:integrase
MAKLTLSAVSKLKPGAERREVPDGGGLRLIIQPSGHKSWALRFRRPDGRHSKLTLGPVDLSRRETEEEPTIGTPLTLAGARWLAAELHRKRARGIDVVSEREKSSTGTFVAAAEAFVEEHARPNTNKWRETAKVLGLDYSSDKAVVVSKSIADRWRNRAISEISSDDVYHVVDEARRRGIPGMGVRTNGVNNSRGRAVAKALSRMFSWLLAHRRVTVNPCIGVHKPPENPARDRVLTTDEVRRLWKACDHAGQPLGPMVKLLLLTGARLREVAHMRWSELSDDLSSWELPGSRTKNGRPLRLALPPLAVKLLRQVPKIEGCEHVFTTNGRTPVSGFSKWKKKIDKAMGKVDQPWTFHDIRRTVATGMAEIGVAPHIVEAVLNHVSGHRGGVAGIYNRAQYADEKKAALAKWAKHVEGLDNGPRPGVGGRRK